MREIKFKAWDVVGKKMYYPGDWPQEESTSHLMWVDMEGIGMLFDGQFIVCDECGNFAYLSPDRYIPMQYTGLKDKDGKEIFEGDLIQVSDIGIAEVIYGFHITSKDSWWVEHGTMGFTLKWVGTDDHSELQSSKDLEIIGNIYENPELLGEEK